ncbi:MAG: alanine/ornithine racemase family PLP-dependent enzyme [Vicingaceae bacterium]
MIAPRIEIDLNKIGQNVNCLRKQFGSKGIELMGVTKVIGGNVAIARVLAKNGINVLADSRMRNIRKMRRAGIKSIFVLLRSPMMSQALEVVKFVDISHNTEYEVIKRLSEISLKRHTKHKVILMLELGDLREGILPGDILDFTEKVLDLKGISLVGIGANLACFGGIEPDDRNMNALSAIVSQIEKRFDLELTYVSGGSSANYNWSRSTKNIDKINYLRLGEAIFLGREPLQRLAIPGLNTDAFTLIAEVIESKTKPSMPYGNSCQDSFGELQHFEDEGMMKRIILGVGRQDVRISGLTPRRSIEILGASSDHLIINKKKQKIEVGQELSFDMNYSALLTAMSSPYIKKVVL